MALQHNSFSGLLGSVYTESKPAHLYVCTESSLTAACFYSAGRSIADEGRQAAPTGARKRQKQGDTSNAAAAGGIEKEADHVLTGHTQCVAGVAWPAESSLVSCSWDHSVSIPASCCVYVAVINYNL